VFVVENVTGCVRTDCPLQNGGCANEECFCNGGYELSNSNICVLSGKCFKLNHITVDVIADNE